MRSVGVVLPASTWAMMPMLRMSERAVVRGIAGFRYRVERVPYSSRAGIDVTPNARISKGYGKFGARRLAGSRPNHEPFCGLSMTVRNGRRNAPPDERKSLITQRCYRLLPRHPIAMRTHGRPRQDQRNRGRCGKPQGLQLHVIGEAREPPVHDPGGHRPGDEVRPW